MATLDERNGRGEQYGRHGRVPGSPQLSGSPSRSNTLRWLGISIGLLLIIAAIVVVVRQRAEIAAALDAMRSPSPLLIAILLGSVALNLVLSAFTFSLLMSRYAPGRVGVIEMQALIASTALVNFLPLRPGLFGRIAYHRAVNGIPVLDSTRVLIEGALLTLMAAALLAALAILSHWMQVRLEGLIIIPAFLLLALCFMPGARILAVAAFVRYTEVLIWAVRYLAVFALVGSPIEPAAAVGFACVSILATMVPFVSNGLGLREWLVGLLAPVLTGYRLELGIAADLVNRGAEIAIVVAMGLIGMAYLARFRRPQCAGGVTEAAISNTRADDEDA